MGSPSSLRVKTVEETHIRVVALPPKSGFATANGSLSESVSLPLTFLDIPWLLFPPTQTLFFFQVDHEDEEEDFFSSCLVPKLKRSLSSALQHFFPLASRLHHHHHQLQFLFSSDSDSDWVPLTVAVAEDADFGHLCSNQPRDAAAFHLLLPGLPSFTYPLPTPTPLLALQITSFPNAKPNAFSIGLACHPVICDLRTFHLFLSTWASFSNLTPSPPPLLPSFDRSPLLLHPTALRFHSFLSNQCLHSLSLSPSPSPSPSLPSNLTTTTFGMLRATFVMNPSDIHNTKLRILAHCDKTNTPYPVLLSPYVVTCAFVWACFAQAQAQAQAHAHPHTNGSMLMYLGFIAGGITRLTYPVATNYFGNCVAFGRAVAKMEDLTVTAQDGILAAAHAIAHTIKDLDADVLGQAHNWIPDWEPIIGSDLHINIVGSPKVELYKIDFGWGTPKKIEEISIDGMRGVSLLQSRDVNGGIEIGLTLPTSTMHAFSSLFNDRLTFMASSSSSSSSSS